MNNISKKSNQNFRVSIVIPTFERLIDLEECLISIKNQSKLPFEILVIDNSNSGSASALINKITPKFKFHSIKLYYFINPTGNSASEARNYGAQLSRGDIVIFLDDDVILNKNFINEILKVFENEKTAIGVQGIQTNIKPRIISNILRMLFFDYHLSKNKCNVFPCVTGNYPYELSKIINSKWLPGFNQAFRREIFNDFQFENIFRNYSDGEDFDLSYRIYKKYKNSLFITPNATLIHKKSIESRMSKKNVILMQEVHELYLKNKLFDLTIKNQLFYYWNRFGRIIIPIIESIVFISPKRIFQSYYRLKAYIVCLIHLKKIKNGDFKELLIF